MARPWFKHEDGIEEGEKIEPILGPRYSPFWFFGVFISACFLLMVLWMSCSFVFSNPR